MEIRETLENRAADIEGRVRPEIDAVKDKLNDVNAKIVGFIKKYPAQTLLGAVALGYLVGRIARAGGRHASK